jgi:hypothetical protein
MIFEHTLQLTQEQYEEIWGITSPRLFPLSLCIVAGLLSLLSKYTFILGALLLMFSVLAIFIPRIIPVGVRRSWKGNKYLHQTLKCGFGDYGLTVRGKTIEVKMAVLGDVACYFSLGGRCLLFFY